MALFPNAVQILNRAFDATASLIGVGLKSLLAGEDLVNNVLGVARKAVASASYAFNSEKNAGAATKANFKGSAGATGYIRVTNANAAVRYLQLHNKATVPAAADTAADYWLLPAGTAAAPSVSIIDTYRYFNTGMGWAISTTATTFTDSATAGDHTVYIEWI